MRSKIRDYKGEINEQVKQLQLIGQSCEFGSVITKEIEEIEQCLQRVDPSLMFYGVYNAGKSSLLNAIFGELKASVADVPETHQITNYKWENFNLVDTPGINGPIEDYKLSKPELRKHNVIMFVVDDSDTFDSSIVANEIVEIIAAGKPLIIVLNKKQNSEEEIINDIRSKLYENIQKAAQLKNINHIEQKYQFIAVNANTAYRAKSENKAKLLEISKIQDLEILITDELKKIDEIKMLLTPIDLMFSAMDKLSGSMKDNIQEENGKQLAEELHELSKQKSESISHLSSMIRMEIRKYSDLMYSAVTSGSSIEGLQQELSDRIGKYITEEVENSYNRFNIELNEMIQKPELQLYVNTEKLDTASVSAACAESNFEESKGTSGFDAAMNIASAAAATKMAPMVLPLPTPIPIPIPVVVAVVHGVISFFKGNREKDRKIAELQAQIEQQNARQHEEMNRRMNALQEARTQINLQLHKYEEEALKSASENIEAFYKGAYEYTNQLISISDQKEKEFLLVNENLSKVYEKLTEIRSELQ
ncbi:MAG: 50S ribosome-binding GTPase [bacterium]|nr:50S ribosome-binding GTPase [bacterium]